MSLADRLRWGEGRRALRPLRAGGSLEKATSSSGSAASDRTATDTARLNGSEGDSGFIGRHNPRMSWPGLSGPSNFLKNKLDRPHKAGDDNYLCNKNLGGAFRQFLAKAALIEFRHAGAFQLVALVEEGETEGETDIAEDLGILRPGDHGARTHHGGQIPRHEGVAGHVGQPHHGG